MTLDYNTRMVVTGAGMLGAVSGLVGVYLLLRKRSLIGDAISHATLPGLVIAFLIQVALGGTGRDLVWLLVFSGVSGILGALTVLVIRRWTNLKEDAALAIVLSTYFGLGMALLSVAQQTQTGNPAGLEGFIFGKTASIVASDALIILSTSVAVTAVIVACRKELKLLCFDPSLASAQGWPVLWMDLLLLGSVLLVVVVGITIVGALLVIALLVIPPASSRFWTHSLNRSLYLSAAFGAASGVVGALTSLFIDKIPSGAAIVLAASFFFGISLVFGSQSGLLWKFLNQRRQRVQADQEHVLRAVYELLESRGRAPSVRGETRSDPVEVEALVKMRAWSRFRLAQSLRQNVNNGWLLQSADGVVTLSASGIQQALKSVRRHRLLELYFSRWADLSPDAIDRGADYTEHALDDELLAMLEKDAMSMGDDIDLPNSIHPIAEST